jgi:hypothetical protein
MKLAPKVAQKYEESNPNPSVCMLILSFSSFIISEVPGHLKLAAGGKPSTWLPPGGLVEHIFYKIGASPQPNSKYRFKV